MKRLALGIGLLALLLGAGRATATPINVNASREVVIGSEHPIFPISLPGAFSPFFALGPFIDSVYANLGDEDVSALQSSNIQPATGLFAGTGNANVGFSVIEEEEIFAFSFFDVFFDITTPHGYSLSGELAANIDGGQGLGLFVLDGPTPIDSLGYVAVDFGTIPLAAAGVLSQGSYHLTVLALVYPGETIEPYSFMGGSSSFEFEFGIQEITTTPEPATLALLAFGLMGLGLARRGKRAL